ncbi:hypothetical protein PSE_4977 [Pseudovibrio sp. FO-BEG1]|nr:hypothetical protein PSE_4977 [Pseudovibrio sp. FO-BEG1]
MKGNPQPSDNIIASKATTIEIFTQITLHLRGYCQF